MNKEHSLEEDVLHGTKERPVTAMHFITGPGTMYEKKFYVQRHWHHSIEILKIVKGSYTVELNLENYILYEGDICIINSSELHKIDGNEEETIHQVVIFDPRILEFSYKDEFQEQFVEPLLSHKYSLPHIIHQEEKGYVEISKLYKEMIWNCLNQRQGWYFSTKILLLQMLNEFQLQRKLISSSSIQTGQEKERIDRYKRIVSYMEAHFSEKVTLEQLADAAQCNPQYLCHFFREIAGVSPIQYLITYRMEKAQEILRNTTKTVLEVSLDCGFDNVSYFIRQFKRGTGKTPGAYRK